jgi:lysophospholipase L1-like esterase
MVESSRKAGITPILATEVTIRGKAGWSEPFEVMIGKLLGKSSYQDYVNGHVIETNRWIRDLATREGLLLLDLETVLGDPHGIRQKEFAKPDGSHISPQGYEAVMRYSEEKLRVSLGPR